MENINGCTVVDPSEIDGILHLTGKDTGGAFSALIGTIPAGAPAPALHEHSTTDEGFVDRRTPAWQSRLRRLCDRYAT